MQLCSSSQDFTWLVAWSLCNNWASRLIFGTYFGDFLINKPETCVGRCTDFRTMLAALSFSLCSLQFVRCITLLMNCDKFSVIIVRFIEFSHALSVSIFREVEIEIWLNQIWIVICKFSPPPFSIRQLMSNGEEKRKIVRTTLYCIVYYSSAQA